MEKISVEKLLALNPDIDPDELEEVQRLADRLKGAGLERAKYRLATPLTGRHHRDHRQGAKKDRPEPHAHMVRRH